MSLSTTPHPTRDQLELSQQLTQTIRREISLERSIPFRRFMEMALYEPALGYYHNGFCKIGSRGDFITAPEVSPLFSQAIARQCLEIFPQLASTMILELGAGNGVMASDILLYLESQQRLPDRYGILELSPFMQHQQRELLNQRCPHLLDRVQWLDRLPDPGLQAVILANEVLDAMPITRFHQQDDHIQECHVAWHDDQFVWQLHDNLSVTQSVSQLNSHWSGVTRFCSEFNPALDSWLQSFADVLDRGAMFIIDYGFPRHEYYHPQRAHGTLMCHFKHTAHSDPLIHVGIQDITAHVDFSAVAIAASSAGFDVAGYTNQAFFLLGCDIASLVHEQQREFFHDTNAIKKLTSPNEMGELFKVIALTKSLQPSLIGFQFQNAVARL